MTGKVPNIVPTTDARRFYKVARVFYSTKYQTWIARRYPSGNGGQTPGRIAAKKQFAACQQMIKNATPEDYEAAEQLAANTPLLRRDVLMKAAYGTLIQATEKSGQTWMGVRIVYPTAQQMLDSIGIVQGSILYRDETSWVLLEPGISGQVLTTKGEGDNPVWADGGGGGGGSSRQCQIAIQPNAGQSDTSGSWLNKLTPVQDISVKGIGVNHNALSGATYVIGFALFDNSTGKLTGTIYTSDPVTMASAVSRHAMWFNLPTAVDVAAGQSCAIFISRTDAPGTTSMAVWVNSAGGSGPAIDASPLSGDTFATSTTVPPNDTASWSFSYSGVMSTTMIYDVAL